MELSDNKTCNIKINKIISLINLLELPNKISNIKLIKYFSFLDILDDDLLSKLCYISAKNSL